MQAKKRYVVDIETASACDLPACGARVYAEHPTTRVLCLAYCDADGDDAPRSWSFLDGAEALEAVKAELLSADRLIAHNAGFERAVLSERVDHEFARSSRWADTARLCGVVGRPQSLRDACRSLCLPSDKAKDAVGVRLINLFSKIGARGHKEPLDAPEDFQRMIEYCRQDVIAERELWRLLSPHEDAMLATQSIVDMAIDDNGVPLDLDEVAGALELYTRIQEKAEAEAVELTGGAAFRSTVALRKWTADRGWPLSSFSAAAVEEALLDTYMCDAHPDVAALLALKSSANGTAGKKFTSMLAMCARDGRCHGVLQARAAVTGRYAGRGIQPQNMPRGSLDKFFIPIVRDIAKKAAVDADAAESELALVCGRGACSALASILRDCIAAPEGKTFVVSDYSAIEARVLAWVAGEAWVNEIFSTDGKIYERTAGKIFSKDFESVTKSERMAGKVATLALGYNGAQAALQRMGANYGVHFNDAEARAIVDAWRASRPETVNFWAALDGAFGRVLDTGAPQTVKTSTASFRFESVTISGRRAITCQLPSKRKIFYWNPQRILSGKKSEFVVEVYGTQTATGVVIAEGLAEGSHAARIYGGKICENIVQAVAFDLLLNSLIELYNKNYKIVFHVHDEIIIEADESNVEADAEIIKDVMETAPAWARGLCLKTEPEITNRYKK